MSILRSLKEWFFPRTVWLKMYDGTVCSAIAHRSEAGWAARWVGNKNQWSILNPDGTVQGTHFVEGWCPRSGWRGGYE